MPRAMMLFRKTGTDPVASPAGFMLKYGSGKYPFSWIPYSGNIRMMEAAFHEYVGIIWSKAGGR